MRVAALILAAGSSKRMGIRNKLLVMLNDLPILSHVLNQLPYQQLNKAVLITGHERLLVEKLVQSAPVETVFNPAFSQGMSTSIAAGLKQLPLELLGGVIICLGDMPYLSSEDYTLLITTFRELKPEILVPTWQGKRGNPVVLSMKKIQKLQQLGVQDRGARQLIDEATEGSVHFVEMENNACLRDIDTPSDIQ